MDQRIEYIDVFNKLEHASGSLKLFTSKYPHYLPFCLNFEMVNSQIVKKFGDTKHKGGGNLPIWIRYEHLGLEFGFLNKDWNDNNNPIVYIKVFKRAEEQTECTLCLKNLKALELSKLPICEKCGLAYCS